MNTNSGTNIDNRPVMDVYKYWTVDAIKADLDTKRNNFSVVCCNVQGDFNCGTIIRNANAFLANHVYIYGKRKWDRRGAVGAHNYINFDHVSKLDELEEVFKLGRVVAVENVPDAINITEYGWSKNDHIVMVFGEESVGIPQNVLDLADDIVYIPHTGSVRSLNVGCASSIAMYDYCLQTVF